MGRYNRLVRSIGFDDHFKPGGPKLVDTFKKTTICLKVSSNHNESVSKSQLRPLYEYIP